MAIRLGPIIGKVTTSTARILVDCDTPTAVDIVVKKKATVAGAATVTCTDLRPVKAVTIGGLAPDTTYKVELSTGGKVHDRKGSFTTFGDDVSAVKGVVFSCSDYAFKPKVDLHAAAFRTHVEDGGAAFALHIGDQIYADKLFDAHSGALQQLQAGTWATHADLIKRAYREHYRDSWEDEGLHDILSNTMNLMLWDDHDVTGDFADRGKYHDPSTARRFVARLGWLVYREYQRQLWDDIDDPDDAALGLWEGHVHRWGPLGMLFIDNRGGRAFSKPASKPYLSPQQWGAIRAAFASGGTLDGARALLVITPMPLVFMGPESTGLYDNHMDDLHGHWAHEPFRAEQYLVLNLLDEWKRAQAGREVMVLGGDVHTGAVTDINRRASRTKPDEPAFQQLITGPVRRAIEWDWASLLYKKAVKDERLLFWDEKPTYTHTLREFLHEPNYAVVNVRFTKQRATIKGTLVSE